MKQYTVLCTSITGKHGRQLVKGESYPEIYFMHIEEHLKNKHIEETKATPVLEPAKTPDLDKK